MKVRIIERVCPNGRREYVIQQKHYLFKWWWVDAHCNSWDFAGCRDYFNSFEEAEGNLCWFDGTKYEDHVYKTYD